MDKFFDTSFAAVILFFFFFLLEIEVEGGRWWTVCEAWWELRVNGKRGRRCLQQRRDG
jgi:hypothetical protein